jgi:hypothetical protein
LIVLFIGDIVGAAGRKALRHNLPYLKRKYRPDFILVNGENAAGGRGLTGALAREFFDLGVQGITMGNHTWDNKDIFDWIDSEPRLVRPANFPEGTPGRGAMILREGRKRLAVLNLQGRTFLPPLDDPFEMADRMVAELREETRCILVDFHAEATSEKVAMGWHLDGKVSALVGTHTHVQTHDERVLPQGTAYVTDVGMTGSSEGVLGMNKDAVLYRFRTQLPARFHADDGKWQLHAVVVDIDEETGRARSIRLVRIYEDDVLLD